MANRQYRIVPLPDGELVRALVAVAGEFARQADSRLHVTLHQVAADLPVADIESHAAAQPFLTSRVPGIESITLTIPSYLSVSVTRIEEGYDRVSINLTPGVPQDASTFATHISQIGKHLPLERTRDAIDVALGEELNTFYRRREAALMRLESLTQDQLEGFARYRREVDEEFAQRRAALTTELDARRAAELADLEKQRGALEARESALAEREKSLDDRESRHVRRQLREALKAELASRAQSFQLSSDTRSKRRIIHGVFCGALAVLGLVLWFSFPGEVKPSDPVFWIALGKAALSSLGLVMTAIYYIRWNDAWFRQHADEEFRLRQMDLDIDRASWVVEMALEWKREQAGAPIPQEIIEGVTRNLFADRTGSSATHPIEDLTAGVLAASGVELELPGGSKIKYDRRALRQAAKAKNEARP